MQIEPEGLIPVSNGVSMRVLESVELGYKNVNETVIDLDAGVELIVDFNTKTTTQAREFRKLSKKLQNKDDAYKQKGIIKFIKKEVFPAYKVEFLDKFYKGGEYEVLDEKVLLTYCFGAFLGAHATNSQMDFPAMLKMLIIEMTNRIYSDLFRIGREDSK